ncbi:hypothetical protein ACLOJK_019471, partial [Asimina triloba]
SLVDPGATEPFKDALVERLGRTWVDQALPVEARLRNSSCNLNFKDALVLKLSLL